MRAQASLAARMFHTRDCPALFGPATAVSHSCENACPACVCEAGRLGVPPVVPSVRMLRLPAWCAGVAQAICLHQHMGARVGGSRSS